MPNSITIKPKNSISEYAALDINDKSIIIAEGNVIKDVINKANKSGKEYLITNIPKQGQTYIY